MNASQELRGRLEGLKIKPSEGGTDVDVVFSFPLRQNDGPVDLAGLVRPEDAKALGVSDVDGLPVEPDGCVTPGCLFFVVAG